MQHVSNAFSRANKQVHFGRFYGEVRFDPVHSGNTGFSFTDADILADSITITHLCSSTDDITIGGVFLGKMEMTFTPDSPAGDKDLDYFSKAMISLWYEIYAEGGWESVKVGDYYVKSTMYQNGFIKLTCYDGMCLFDVPLDSYPAGSIFRMTKQAVDRVTMLTFDISLHLGMIELEFQMLPNGTYQYSSYPVNDMQTYRDVLYWIAQSVGGYFYVDRNGGLMLVSYERFQDRRVDAEVDYDERVAGSSQIYDFLTGYDGVQITDIQKEEIVQDINQNAEKIYDLGENPFYQYLDDQQKSYFMSELKDIVTEEMVIRPYKIDMCSAPIYDVGDKILFTDGDWTKFQETPTIIHSWTWSKNRLTLEGFGADRTKITSHSSSSKIGTGSEKAKTIEYYYIESFTQKQLDNMVYSDIELGTINFSANGETNFEVIAQSNPVLVNSGGLQSYSYEIEYYWLYDGMEIHQAYFDGADGIAGHKIHTLPLFATATTPGLHTLTLRARWLNGQSSKFEWRSGEKNVTILLKGQNLGKVETWNGLIQISEGYERIVPLTDIAELSETIELDFMSAMTAGTFSGTYSRFDPTTSVSTLTEQVDLTIETPTP